MIRTLSLCLLAVASGSVLAVDGLPDSTFGFLASGRNVISLNQGGSNSDSIVDVLVNPDRSIFMVGTSRGAGSISRYAITKLAPNGLVDISFGSSGSVYSVGANLTASRARLDTAGNVVIVGTATINGSDKDFSVCRYSPQGQPVTFSALGTNCRNIAFDVANGNLTDQARDFRFDSAGRIVIAGVAGFSTSSDYAAITRLTLDGQVDTTFSGQGRVKRQFVPNAINHYNALAIRPDGKFYAVGEAGNPLSIDGTGMLFARLASAGAADPAYQNGNGFTVSNFDNGVQFHRDDVATAVEVLSDGKILVAGLMDMGTEAGQRSTFLLKLEPMDMLAYDATFADVGRFYGGMGYGRGLNKILMQSDNKIVIIGSRKANASADSMMHVMRLPPGGQFDTTQFGTNGRVDVDFLLAGGDDYGVAAASQAGSLLIAGHSKSQNSQDLDQTITRLHNDLIFADGLE